MAANHMTAANQFNLTGSIVLVTGGQGFLGRHFMAALKDAGATAISADIADGADVTTDVTSAASIQAAFDSIIAEHGQIDVVVNNAAIDPKFDAKANKNTKLFESYPTELLRRSLDVNLLGYVLVAQTAVKYWLSRKKASGQGRGHIINISSIYGEGGPDQRLYPAGTQKPVDYAIAKGGVKLLTKWLATTYGEKGIRANTITLGGVLKGHDKEFQKKYSARTPLGRMMQPEEVGGPLVFLASGAARYMTGANLIVDGGWTAW